MLRKRYTIELVLEIPAKGDLGDALRVNENSLVVKKSQKILKIEEFDELMPHEMNRGGKKAVKESILELLKKRKLPLLVSYNQDWGDSIRLYIHSSKAGERAYFERVGHKECKTWETRHTCRYCKLVNMSLSLHVEDGSIYDRTWGPNKQANTLVGTISDPEMVKFMEYLEDRFKWCKP